MPPSNLVVQPQSPLPIGRSVHFVSGPFANRTVRAELDELQKADLGRKCGNRDRRPLDPPPVVRLRLFETFNEGTPQESEREVSDVNEAVAYGFICYVDLFQWPPPPCPNDAEPQREPSPPKTIPRPTGPRSEALPSLASIMTQLVPSSSARADPHGMAYPSSSGAGPSRLPLRPGPPAHTPERPLPGTLRVSDLPLTLPSFYYAPANAAGPEMEQHPSGQRDHSPESAAVVDGVPVPEYSSRTHAFVGATFVSASCFHHEGRPTLLFVFPDLACNMDGTFLLRYRALNLFGSALETHTLPVFAECWGGPVIVYPTKDFPGLAESTELTKYLSRFGVPVNIRQGERKKRNRGEKEKIEVRGS
ncbi:velvet factor [Fomitopsis serialis]|uniref:velvet factor n=1 Tax=Fomitopsis serialis TaxID=139415 RepID=UPI00200877E4|nr:velvet factor [Neoantrodia serialis]KAH9925295.1 velvet factor [Neoantrodia serialis]